MKIQPLLFPIGIELKSTFREFILHSDSDFSRIEKKISQNFLSSLQTAKRGETLRNMASIFRPELMYIKRLLQNTFQKSNANYRIALQKSIKASMKSRRI